MKPAHSAVWQQAFKGWIISALPITLTTGAGWIFAKYTVAAHDPKVPTDLSAVFVDAVRTDYLILFAIWIALLGVHWGTSGTLGRGDVSKVWSANALIAIAIISGIAAPVQFALALSLTGIRDTVCKFLGIMVSFPPLPERVVRFDGVTDCERFGQAAAFATTVFIPLGLILLATAMRVMLSRKQQRLAN